MSAVIVFIEGPIVVRTDIMYLYKPVYKSLVRKVSIGENVVSNNGGLFFLYIRHKQEIPRSTLWAVLMQGLWDAEDHFEIQTE